MSKEDTNKFVPPWWLKNKHLQSCFHVCFPPKAQTALIWEQLELPDGDFIDVCWAGHATDSSPLVVLLHGLEGSVRSHYIQLLLDSLVAAGYQVAVMHFRTCSGRLNRLPRAYHAGETEDLHYFLQVLMARYPRKIISALGFSLGGNVLLNYLVRYPRARLDRAVVVSVPFELNRCADYLATVYHWSLLRTMKQKVYEKIKLGYSMPINEYDLKEINDFRGFDEFITAPLHGFSSADDYYEKVTVRHSLKRVQHPVLIIHAMDDPLVPAECIPTPAELSSSILLEVSQQGGHIGFVNSVFSWREFWLRQRILDFLLRENSVLTPTLNK